ncbi:MAG: aldolase/citrate lyase family protein [Phaeobacter gallaeciensis]
MINWLFVPGDRPDLYQKAATSGADAVIWDLEDAVAPNAKDEARSTVATHLDMPDARSVPVVVRLNSTMTAVGLSDLLMLQAANRPPEAVILPKIENRWQVEQVRIILALGVKIVVLIESATGLAERRAILKGPVDAVLFGAGDYSSDIGAECSWAPLHSARTRIVEAAAEAGVPAIDSPFFDVRDNAALAEECRAARTFGFSGKAAIHPQQVAKIQECFRPTASELDWARRALTENEKGAGVVDGKLIDEAIARRARRILGWQEAGWLSPV